MPIPFNNYVNITSEVDGAGTVPAVQLIIRMFSTNPLIPANSFAQFTSAAAVGAYFGFGSVEYLRASFCFSFVSKQGVTPPMISIASFVNANRAPQIYGDPLATDTLAQFTAITAGKINLQLGATSFQVVGINLSAAASLAAVAADITTAIQAAEPSDPVWAGAVVSYNTSVLPGGACFELTGGGTSGSGTVAVSPATGGGVDLGLALGWESPNAIISQGSPVQTLTATLTASNTASNNFGSFLFLNTLTQANFVEIATWLATTNVQYMALFAITPTEATACSAALLSYPGCAMTLAPLTTQYPEMIPGMIMAATNYNLLNASQNYMYQYNFPGLTPSVADPTDQANYDVLRINYYGQTQQSGTFFSFYQRGFLTGGVGTPLSMTTYVNEIWFKNGIAVNFMNLLLAVNEIPANMTGRGMVMNVINAAIVGALKAGIISPNSAPLTVTQIQSIIEITGSQQVAWQQVQTIGYWFDVSFSSFINGSGATEWQANYILVYAKNNVVNKIVGTHNLI